MSQCRRVPVGAPGGRPRVPATTCAVLRGGPGLRLCAPPKTLRTLQPPPARFSQQVARLQVPRQPLRSRRCLASGSRLFPRRLQFPPRGLPRGCRSAAPSPRWAGGAGATIQMTTSPGPGSTRGTDWSARPSPPTPARLPRAYHAEASERNTFSYLPAAEDHTLRSALSTHPPAAGEGSGAPLLFPGVGRSV